MPEKYHHLKMLSKCHEEPFYDCIATELDKFDFEGLCDKKCIPKLFRFGKNYTTPFCQNQMEDNCANGIIKKMVQNNQINNNNTTQKFKSTCKKACNILQYSGNFMSNISPFRTRDNKSQYQFYYEFANSENRCNIFQEYLIYDTMGMIGSVGGTLGMFIGFSMTGVISSLIGYFGKCVSNLKQV